MPPKPRGHSVYETTSGKTGSYNRNDSQTRSTKKQHYAMHRRSPQALALQAPAPPLRAAARPEGRRLAATTTGMWLPGVLFLEYTTCVLVVTSFLCLEDARRRLRMGGGEGARVVTASQS